MKKNTIKLTIPGSEGWHPQIGGSDPVSDGGKVTDSSDVTDWLLSKLADIHADAKKIISDHLASIRPPETGYSAKRYRRKTP